MKAYLLIIPALLALASAGDARVLFEDNFDGQLQSGWRWVRFDNFVIAELKKGS